MQQLTYNFFQALQAVAILQAASNPILVYRPHRGEKTCYCPGEEWIDGEKTGKELIAEIAG